MMRRFPWMPECERYLQEEDRARRRLLEAGLVGRPLVFTLIVESGYLSPRDGIALFKDMLITERQLFRFCNVTMKDLLDSSEENPGCDCVVEGFYAYKSLLRKNVMEREDYYDEWSWDPRGPWMQWRFCFEYEYLWAFYYGRVDYLDYIRLNDKFYTIGFLSEKKIDTIIDAMLWDPDFYCGLRDMRSPDFPLHERATEYVFEEAIGKNYTGLVETFLKHDLFVQMPIRVFSLLHKARYWFGFKNDEMYRCLLQPRVLEDEESFLTEGLLFIEEDEAQYVLDKGFLLPTDRVLETLSYLGDSKILDLALNARKRYEKELGPW
jgi:hypothetical protein